MEDLEPLVSVIIPTKNSSRTLEKCLESIKNQTYKNIELIVVDNNSTDNTKDIANKYTDMVFNFGPERSYQRNYGVKKSNGEFSLIHDSDIYFNKNTIKECVEVIKKYNSDAIIIPEKSIGYGFWTKVKAFERSFYIGNDYIEGARFFKKDVYNKIGGYDENLYAGEDWDITIRLRQNNYKISRVINLIEHDEGEINLFGSSKKKKYYAPNLFDIYSKKHPKEFKKQMNFFVRFPINKLFINFIKHPILTICMFLMKSIELFNSIKK